MKKLLTLSAIAVALVLSSSTHAFAASLDNHPVSQGPAPKTPSRGALAPEVDPSLALSGLTLLGGSLTVLRMRRRKQ
jgi:LPXTG-motif cell wall-anchored protein